MREPNPAPRRYLGLELSGAKNPKTSIAAIEFYSRERKIFLLDIYDRILPNEDKTGDETLLEVLSELSVGVARMGVNVPLGSPPCATCTRKSCPLPAKCTVPSVKWMREITRRVSKLGARAPIRAREFTPYTQRPVELWARYNILPKLPEAYRFEIDETLGGNKAPLTARMAFLRRHLTDTLLVEVWPKLVVTSMASELQLSRRTVMTYRNLEEGIQARSDILERLSEHHGIFIYERDLRKLSQSLTAFDAFLCAYTALLSDSGGCARIPSGFPAAGDWIQFPKL